MAHRDPDTGKFVSDDDGHLEVVSGRLSLDYEAADLTTAGDAIDVSGGDSVIVDLDDHLDSNEVMDIKSVDLVVQIDPQRTATAEHNYRLHFDMGTDYLPLPTTNRPIVGSADDGTGDIAQGEKSDQSYIFSGSLTGSGDFADSATGVGAGADQNHLYMTRRYHAEGLPAPTVDEDDEITVPFELYARGSDDQGFQVHFTTLVQGTVREV